MQLWIEKQENQTVYTLNLSEGAGRVPIEIEDETARMFVKHIAECRKIQNELRRAHDSGRKADAFVAGVVENFKANIAKQTGGRKADENQGDTAEVSDFYSVDGY